MVESVIVLLSGTLCLASLRRVGKRIDHCFARRRKALDQVITFWLGAIAIFRHIATFAAARSDCLTEESGA